MLSSGPSRDQGLGFFFTLFVTESIFPSIVDVITIPRLTKLHKMETFGNIRHSPDKKKNHKQYSVFRTTVVQCEARNLIVIIGGF